MTLVAVSILNFNSASSTINCVQSLLNAEQDADNQYQLRIVLTDNASGPEDYALLQETFAGYSNVHLRRNTQNLGFAAGHNRNLHALFDAFSPDFVWLLNNDCVVDAQTLPAYLRCAKQQADVGIWGATLLESDGKTIQCAGGCFYNSWLSSYRQHGNGTPLLKLDQIKPADYDYLAGASLFFPIATLQQGLGPVPILPADTQADSGQWLNEVFFLYFEELDLAKRLQPGFRMAWCKDALIRHVGGSSTGTQGPRRSEEAEYHSTLSALKFTQLYYPNRLWLMVPGRFIAKCLQLSLRGNFRLIKPMIQAYRDFWRFK